MDQAVIKVRPVIILTRNPMGARSLQAVQSGGVVVQNHARGLHGFAG
jgi:hypothetical protein